MEKAIVTISMDDSRLDQFAVIRQILLPRKIPCTVNIIPGFISGELQSPGGRYTPKPMTVEQLQEMQSYGLVEIAGHGYMHQNDWSDIAKGQRQLLEWLKLPEDTKLGFASPGSQMPADYILQNADRRAEIGLLYIRTGYEIRTNRSIRLGCRKLSRILHSGKLYTAAYRESFQSEISGGAVLGIPLLRDTTLRELKAVVRYAQEQHLLCTLIVHGVLRRDEPGPRDNWCYDYDRFEQLAHWLAQERSAGLLELMTTRDVIMRTEK